MKKVATLIVILPLALITLTAYGMRAVHSYGTLAIQPSLIDQKPRGDELTEEFHQTYQLSPSGRVTIANINGDVRINVWDQNSVKVDAVKRAYSQERLSEMTIDVDAAADSVRIRTKYPDRQTYRGRDGEDSAGSVEYTLTVPRRATLEGAELVNGSLDIEGIEGDVHASLVNGAVRATGLSGEVKLATVNGRLDVNLAGMENSKNINLSSVNGSIVLRVPGGANADVKASTVHGAITNDFGFAVEDGQYVGHNMSGQIGSGGARVRLNNVNGSIAVKRGAV